MVNWNLFARLSISTLPATTLECSDANGSGVLLVLSFQSLKNGADMGRGVTAALEVLMFGESFMTLTPGPPN